MTLDRTRKPARRADERQEPAGVDAELAKIFRLELRVRARIDRTGGDDPARYRADRPEAESRSRSPRRATTRLPAAAPRARLRRADGRMPARVRPCRRRPEQRRAGPASLSRNKSAVSVSVMDEPVSAQEVEDAPSKRCRGKTACAGGLILAVSCPGRSGPASSTTRMTTCSSRQSSPSRSPRMISSSLASAPLAASRATKFAAANRLADLRSSTGRRPAPRRSFTCRMAWVEAVVEGNPQPMRSIGASV